MFGVVAVFGVEAFFESIIHGVDGGLAVLIAIHGFDVGVLDEKEDKNKRGEGCHDDNFENGEALFFVHRYIIHEMRKNC